MDDPHYELKHGDSINDELILKLLWRIGGQLVLADTEAQQFRFYEVELEFQEKPYRLILVTPLDWSYLGVRNAYRRSK